MNKVLLGDVAVEHKETCKGSKDGYPIVGLEHLIPEEITLTAWDEGSENTFSKMFRKGNVLFGRRRAYLKKAAVAPFDGICSGDITVIEAKPDRILPELLPFIIQNDDLFDFAVGKSAGSLSPRVKWEHLKNYEFELPDMEKQKELAELLWAMDNTKKSYQKLIVATDELVKSQFIEMFGDPVKNPFGWPTMTLDQATKEIVSGQCLNGDAGKLQPGQKAVLKVSAVTYGSFDANEYKVLRDTKQITKGIYPQKGDLLFSRANTREYVGATVLIDQDYPELMLPDKLWKLIFKHEIMPMFAKQFLSHPEIRKVLSSMATGTSGSMYNISMEKLKRLEIIVPNINQQKEYLDTYQRRGTVSKVTLDNVRRILSSFFAWLEDEDYIVKSPVRRIHKVKTGKTVKETYSDEALELMRDHCDNTRDLAMIDLLTSTGIRVGELVKLNRSDLDFENRECIVFGKGNKQRKVYFDARTKIHLQRYLSERTDGNESLFVSLLKPYERLQISGVEIRLRKIGRELNFNKVHPHKFRRTLATMAIDKGMPIEQVQQLLGHQSIDTTLQYAMVNQNNVKESHRKYIG